MSAQQEQLSLINKGRTLDASFWQQLEKQYRIAIEDNKAIVSKRRWGLRDKPTFTAKAILGTKAVEVTMNSQNGVPGPILDLDAEQTFTESNLMSELKQICLFVLAEWELAQNAVDDGQF